MSIWLLVCLLFLLQLWALLMIWLPTVIPQSRPLPFTDTILATAPNLAESAVAPMTTSTSANTNTPASTSQRVCVLAAATAPKPTSENPPSSQASPCPPGPRHRIVSPGSDQPQWYTLRWCAAGPQIPFELSIDVAALCRLLPSGQGSVIITFGSSTYRLLLINWLAHLHLAGVHSLPRYACAREERRAGLFAPTKIPIIPSNPLESDLRLDSVRKCPIVP